MIISTFKNALQKCLEIKMIAFFSTLFVIIVTSITTIYTHYIAKKTVHETLPSIIIQLANKTHTTHNLINNKMAELVSKCGDWSGGAWLVYNHKTKIINFIEVFANDPYYGGVYPTKYVPGNDFYLLEHELDNFAYEKITNIQEYDIIDMQNDLWLYSKFFQSLQKNIWKITNQKLQKLKITPIAPKNLYLSTVRYNEELIYIFAITVSSTSYCNITQTISSENEKQHYTGVALKKLTLEAMELLDIFNYKI